MPLPSVTLLPSPLLLPSEVPSSGRLFSPDRLCRSFSGVVINQSAAPESSADHLTLTTPIYQTFRLPADYRRAGVRTPDLTGVQIRVGVSTLDAQVAVRLEHKPFFGPWTTLAEAIATSPAVVDDEVWLTCLFDRAVVVEDLETDDFRIRLAEATDLRHVWYTVPNPLPVSGGPKAFGSNATTPLRDGGRELSLGFRVLGAVADSGTDFLGNQYRSAVVRRRVEDTDTRSSQDVYWLSGPQPSKFAVVSQYFDMQTAEDEPVVMDSVLIDPITPGMYAHVYYCNDGDPGTTEEEWEERVWTPVPRVHHALRRDTFVFPEPIRARFVKLEYSHLQARSYPVGGFQKPIEYKKHPKWVLDYFLLAVEDAAAASEERFVSRTVRVNYDAYTLAFSYYKDDLGSQVAPPPFINEQDKANVERFVSSRNDLSDVVDGTTRAQINTVMQPFLYNARVRTTARTLLGEVLALDNTGGGYPVESIRQPTPVSSAVSNSNREAVVFEQTFPVMYFYLPCRHRYRLVSAPLPNDRAYFAGVREIAFTRERYHVESDSTMYTETLGDHFNSERNDFVKPGLPVAPPPPAPGP